MNPLIENQLLQTRRQFFGDTGLRLGGMALASLLGAPSRGAGADLRVHEGLPNLPHFPGKAKSVIYLHMNGGPSQLDTWDYKPNLHEQFGKDLPKEFLGQRITTMTSGQGKFPVAPSKFEFTQHGECGRWVSELLPHTAKVVDDIAVVKTVHTNAINHDPACTFLMTGSEVPGKPSMGSWVSYGLGADTNDLPAFVSLVPNFPKGSNAQALYSRMWGSGFLEGKHSGVVLRPGEDPVLYLENPPGVSSVDRRSMLDTLGELNRRGFAKFGDPDIQTRISQYEMAYRMQSSVPELTDLKQESQATKDLYGTQVDTPGSFARSALLARRMVERGVRMVQILHRGWDSHGNLPGELGNQCMDTDQAAAALVTDLKQRGMLDETLVVWGGEFGRTVYSQGKLTRERYGRDHHPRNFCMWLAGGGIKGGVEVGETDEFSYNAVADPVHINEINATILHCLGIDHELFSVRNQGLEQRLTGVEPMKVIRKILA
ncbi:MAG: DUF1501 domain-containing protein [Verrucomicrobiales bacterium]|nr:DUF1501 domain-containing protein [Verrucomicrobiales bacterium]